MYITINGIKGEARIDLSYPIHSGKEVAVIRMLSNNVQYQTETLYNHGSYFRHKKDDFKWNFSGWNLFRQRVLLSIVEGMAELNQFVVDDQVIKKNKLKGITEITLSLDELDNSDNLKDGRPSTW